MRPHAPAPLYILILAGRVADFTRFASFARFARCAGFALLASLAAATAPARAEVATIPERISVEPPAGWRRADPLEQAALVRRNHGLPEQAPNPDAELPALLFTGPPHEGFTPTLAIRMVPTMWPMTEAGVSRFNDEQNKLLAPVRGRVLLTRVIDAGTRKALRAEARLRPAQVEVSVTMVVFPLRSGSALLAYTMHSGAEAALRPLLEASLGSLRSIEPWHAGLFGGRLFTYALIATIGTAVFVLLLRRRRARTS